jgi:hypothetical protein
VQLTEDLHFGRTAWVRPCLTPLRSRYGRVPPEYSIWSGDLALLAAGLAWGWLASWMSLKIVYLLMRWLFSLVGPSGPGGSGEDRRTTGAPARERGAAPDRWPGAIRE